MWACGGGTAWAGPGRCVPGCLGPDGRQSELQANLFPPSPVSLSPQDYKEAVVAYRARLSSIVRYSAAVLPEQALSAAAARLDAAVAACAPGAGTAIEDARSRLESAVHFTESTLRAVWDGSGGGGLAGQPARLQGAVAAMEPMLLRLLGLQVRLVEGKGW